MLEKNGKISGLGHICILDRSLGAVSGQSLSVAGETGGGWKPQSQSL